MMPPEPPPPPPPTTTTISIAAATTSTNKKTPLSLLPLFLSLLFLLSISPSTTALGISSTISITTATPTVCAITSPSYTTTNTTTTTTTTQSIQCFNPSTNTTTPIVPTTSSFSSVSGGDTFFCGLVSSGLMFFCWNTQDPSFTPKRVYNSTVALTSLSVGDNHICALIRDTGRVNCWRTRSSFQLPSGDEVSFESISSGSRFSCGILRNSRRVSCFGSNSIKNDIQDQFMNYSMSSIVVGGSHACGLDASGFVVCKGDNHSGQLNVPQHSSMEFSFLSLGANHSCGIKGNNKTVVCWGSGVSYSVNQTDGVSFESIVSGSNFSCGLISDSLSIMCWGPGWNYATFELPIAGVLPGPCVAESSCQCGIYPQSAILCSGSGTICSPCSHPISTPPSPQPVPPSPPPPSVPPPSSPSRALRRGLLAFAIVGSVGIVSGICAIVYCLWIGGCFGRKKIHNTVQPTITRGSSNGSTTSTNSVPSRPTSRSSTLRRQVSRVMRRQRSGTSSKHTDKAEEFSLAELAFATGNFSLENKIGAGSFGIVYKGKLPDGREVAIKRGETGTRTNKFQEKESAFDSELAFLSRLHHKHLVRLVGYCEEKDERLLVYEYMTNGALYDHLHDKNNVEKSSSPLNSWRIRIKIVLDAARGIEYLHNYAVPPIIHRDIKSSNILLDANWTARVSDFGLSLMGPATDHNLRPMKAAGTVGYIDPEYYSLNVLTAKSDVYGLGVVLLELLTGKRAIFKNAEDGGTPISVVDFAVPAIKAGELLRLLDPRVGPPELNNEADAVELVAYTAIHCVNLEGKERPTMTDIVANLERALALCDEINGGSGTISSGIVSIASE